MKKQRKAGVMLAFIMTMCLGSEMVTANAEDSIILPAEKELVSITSTSYSSQDIDRNGTTDILDSILLNKCLLGMKYIANNAVLDADGNSIVSAADSNCVLAGAVHNNYSNRVKGTSRVFSSFNTSTVPTTYKSTSQSYSSHNYQNNINSQYTLSLQETSLNVSAMLNSNKPGIIGPDSREADALDGVVYLSSGGTGFIVDDHVIATSAHCVYDRASEQWVSNLRVYLPDEDGKATTTPLYAIEAHMPTTFKTNANDKYDYALITVSEDLSDHYHFNLGMPYNVYTNADFENYTIYSTGYSQYIPDGEIENQLNSYPTPQMYTGEGKLVKGDNVDLNLVCFDTDITYGNSGGPVYVKETYKIGSNASKEMMTVISICSGIRNVDEPHHNMGPTMNAIMLKFFRNNSNISY